MPSYWSQLLDELRAARDEQEQHEQLTKRMRAGPPDFQGMMKSLQAQANKITRGYQRQKRQNKAHRTEATRREITRLRQRAWEGYTTKAITAEQVQQFEARCNRLVTDLAARGQL